MSARVPPSPVWLSLFAGLAVGCSQILGIEDTSVAEAPEDPFSCAAGAVTEVPAAAPIDTEVAGDSVAPSCGSSGARDQTFGFTAPVTDYYVFDTFGASFDTVLSLYDRCNGAELACNDNAGALPQSEVVRKLREGERALVVVEGRAGDTGTGMLHVSRVSCPDADLEEQTFPLTVSTASFGNDLSSACGGGAQEDRAYHWVAPKDGLFAFRADSTTFTPVVNLRAGPRCSDQALGCNSAEAGIGHAEVVRRLKAGDAVTLEVDGRNGAGPVTLNIEERTATCPSEAFPTGPNPVTGRLATRVLAPSCGSVEVPGGVSGSRFELGDHSYSYTMAPVAEGCAATATFELTTSEPMYLYALDGDDCSGAELACTPTAVVGGMNTASVRLPAAVGVAKRYTVVVADRYGQDGTMGTFSLSLSLTAICFAPPAGPPAK
jgi:hypothetical protein